MEPLTKTWSYFLSQVQVKNVRKMKNSRYRYLYGTGTHYNSSKFLNFGDQIFLIPVLRLFSGTIFSDTTKKIKIPCTGTSHSANGGLAVRSLPIKTVQKTGLGLVIMTTMMILIMPSSWCW